MRLRPPTPLSLLTLFKCAGGRPMTKIIDFPLKKTGKETPERILKTILNDVELIENIVIVALMENEDQEEILVLGDSDNRLEVIGLLEEGKYRLLSGDES